LRKCREEFGYFLKCLKVLFKQGDKGDTFWIIIKGEVSIYKRVFQRHDEVKHQSEAEKNKDGLLNHKIYFTKYCKGKSFKLLFFLFSAKQ